MSDQLDYKLLESQLAEKKITLVSLARKAGIPVSTVSHRLRIQGMTLKNALETPLRRPGGDVRGTGRRSDIFWHGAIGGTPRAWAEVLGITEKLFLWRVRAYECTPDEHLIYHGGKMSTGRRKKRAVDNHPGNAEWRALGDMVRTKNLKRIPRPTKKEVEVIK